ncbi:MAG: flagellar motor protein MotB [Deltaproteobacteria bacterium]|nr:flagellar motor protein MotB [Deltaproteobacteria bacterium]
MDIHELLQKEEKPDQEEGAPAWYVSFADMATLLMATFLMLLSFASMDLKKFHKMAGSVQAALGAPGQSASTGPSATVVLPVSGPAPAAPPSDKETLAIVQSLFQDLGGAAEVVQTEDGVTARLEGQVIFLSGDATVRPQARAVLDRVAALLRKYTFDLYILGHTDPTPIETARFPSNWELSSARASAVLRYLAERGTSPQRLVAVGFADSRPLTPNDTPQGRAKNRRVEFVFKAPENAAAGGFKPAPL